jgi:Fe-Mn family superoxide dismutase
LPPLPYGFDALEPHIDKLTMEIHHGRHHKAYVDNLNKAVEGTPMAKLTIEQILKGVSKHPQPYATTAAGTGIIASSGISLVPAAVIGLPAPLLMK